MNHFRENALHVDLVYRLRTGHPDAVEELYHCFRGLVYSIALRAVRNPAIAEDLTQETFLHVWTGIGGFNSQRGALRPWIAAIVQNQIRDHFRSAHVRAMRDADCISEMAERIASTTDEKPDCLQARTLQNSVSSLADDHRNVVLLAYAQGLTQTEIALMMGRPLGTVKTWARQALISLRQQIISSKTPAGI
jgi:RNA polymerase sigma-70 factor (ECF subfamily)